MNAYSCTECGEDVKLYFDPGYPTGNGSWWAMCRCKGVKLAIDVHDIPQVWTEYGDSAQTSQTGSKGDAQ